MESAMTNQMRKLTGSELAALQEALLSAFPSIDDLRQMVRLQLDEHLDHIAGGQNLSNVVFHLIAWAEKEGRLAELVQGACNHNTGNPDLHQWMQEIYPHLLLPSDPAGAVSNGRGRLSLRTRVIIGIPLLVLALLLLWYFSPPFLAEAFYNRGVQYQNQGNYLKAIQQYQRAISLQPDYPQAHYNLGYAFEQMGNYEQAMSAYRVAFQADAEFYAAYNNLAHLALVNEDYTAALELLQTAFAQNLDSMLQEPLLSEAYYTLYKNRGWAYYGLDHLNPAEEELRQALERKKEGAAAYCLLAQVLEAQEPTPADAAIRQAWENCIRYAPGEHVQATWLARARDSLSNDM
jgi:tetratricopeptide (TPR) repeat protein